MRMTPELLASLVRELRVSVRLVLRDRSTTGWSRSVIAPAAGYIELVEHGPVRWPEVFALEFDPRETVRRGRLLEDQVLDHAAELRTRLTANGQEFDDLPSGLTRVVIQPGVQGGSGRRPSR